MVKKYFILAFLQCILYSSFAQNSDWLTDYEKSGLLATPRYTETMAFINRLDQQSPAIHTESFGVSPEGRELLYLVYDRDGLHDAKAIRKAGRIILMVQAGIHPGESEGKDAMLLLLRDLVTKNINAALFEHVSLLFIPIFNVDGHERFSPYGRINQNGPAEMGWRTTAQNLNLNRDFLKADAPEMQAWLKLYNMWQPEFFIDTHTSDGADYQYVITYVLETFGNMDDGLTQWQKKDYLPLLEKHMKTNGFPLFPYVSFRRWHDPRSGLISSAASPAYSQGYTAQRNRPGLLVETHMLKPYHQRVEATKAIIESSLQILNQQHLQLLSVIMKADAYTASAEFREKKFPVRFSTDMTDSSMVVFKGVDYTIENSSLTGGDWFVYDSTKPVEYLLPMFDISKITSSVQLPEAYIIPPAWQKVIERMQLHGISMYPVETPITLSAEIYRFQEVEWYRTPFEGRHRISKMNYVESVEDVTFPRGSMVIPMNQPLARLIAYMLEPKANGSFVEWGFFDGIFEQKEYAETYVMEPLARKMLDSIPGLRQSFEQKKTEDPSFAASQWQQLNWFYRQTPYWDQNYMRYPVGRIMQSASIPEGKIRMLPSNTDADFR